MALVERKHRTTHGVSATVFFREGDSDLQYTMKELRARKRLTQRELGRAIGVSEATIVSWEHDPGRIPARRLWAMADVFGVRTDEIQIFLPKDTDNKTAYNSERAGERTANNNVSESGAQR